MIFPQPVGSRATVRNSGLAGVLAVLLFFFTLAPPGRAATVIFTATDVVDVTPGQDLWEYSYRVSDVTFTANQGFTIFFDRTLYSQLQNPPTFVNADFDLLVVQPDLALMSNGFYDALALRNAPSLADPFRVKFVWLGPGTPGSQPFTIYNTDFSTISQGQTIGVPEPSTLSLLLAASCVLAQRRPRNGVFPKRRSPRHPRSGHLPFDVLPA